jgi:hypothetical protein
MQENTGQIYDNLKFQKSSLWNTHVLTSSSRVRGIGPSAFAVMSHIPCFVCLDWIPDCILPRDGLILEKENTKWFRQARPSGQTLLGSCLSSKSFVSQGSWVRRSLHLSNLLKFSHLQIGKQGWIVIKCK